LNAGFALLNPPVGGLLSQGKMLKVRVLLIY